MKKITPFLILLLSIFVGCKKTSSVGINFDNEGSVKMNYKIYGSKADYSSDKNILLKGSIPAHTTSFISYDFKSGQNYYVDYYSDDYIYNNWLPENGNLGPNPFSFCIDSVSTFLIVNTQQMGAMMVLLNDSLTQTKWKAINSFNVSDPTVSTWGSLSDSERYQEYIFNKDGTAVYRLIFRGDTSSSSFGIRPYYQGGLGSFFMNAPPYTTMNIGNNFKVANPPNYIDLPIKDSLLLERWDDTYLIFVRE